jgi:hypothetical protein
MLNTSRKFTDICKLTPYEEKMWGFASQGMNKKQIAEAMGAKNVGSILPRLKIIKEKIESASY